MRRLTIDYWLSNQEKDVDDLEVHELTLAGRGASSGARGTSSPPPAQRRRQGPPAAALQNAGGALPLLAVLLFFLLLLLLRVAVVAAAVVVRCAVAFPFFVAVRRVTEHLGPDAKLVEVVVVEALLVGGEDLCVRRARARLEKQNGAASPATLATPRAAFRHDRGHIAFGTQSVTRAQCVKSWTTSHIYKRTALLWTIRCNV